MILPKILGPLGQIIRKSARKGKINPVFSKSLYERIKPQTLNNGINLFKMDMEFILQKYDQKIGVGMKFQNQPRRHRF